MINPQLESSSCTLDTSHLPFVTAKIVFYTFLKTFFYLFRVFQSVNDAQVSLVPTFAAFIPLLDNYNPDATVVESKTPVS